MKEAAADLLVVGAGPAAAAALEWARGQGVAVAQVDEAGARLAPGPGGGWQVAGRAARAVVLAGPGGLEIWRAAGGAVADNPALGRPVPVAGSLPGVEVAGPGLGIGAPAAQAKSGRYRARRALARGAGFVP